MSIFTNLKQAKTYEQGRKLPVGEHIVRIDKCLTKRSDQMGTDLYIVEYIAVSSVSSTPAEVGGRYSWVQNNKDANVAQSNIKSFVLAAMRASREKDPAHFAQCEDQCEAIAVASVETGLLNGQIIHVTTQWVKTQKTRQDFLQHTFRPYFGVAQ